MTTSYQAEVARRESRRAISVHRLVLVALLVGCLGMTHLPAASADPAATRAQEWWITRLDLQHTWTLSKGAGVIVALLDTGVNASVGDLRGAVTPGFTTTGTGDGRTDTSAEIHGTRLASLIAGRGTDPGVLGVAPAATILPVLVPTSSADNTAAALNRLSAMPRPPAVVNMSYGAATPCSQDVQAAVKQAVGRGMILVASAGNDGTGLNLSEAPGNCAGVIAVGAVADDATAWAETARQPYVALAAPGVHIVGLNPSGHGLVYSSGTSDSAAIVSGIFADLRAHFPSMPARQLVARVLYTARQFEGTQGVRNQTTGFGVARPYHALVDTVPASAPNPIYDALDKIAASSSPATSPVGGSTAGGSSAPGTPAPAAASSKTSNTGVVAAGIAAAVIVVLIILGVLRSRRRRGHYPPQPGGYGTPGP